MSKPEVFDLGYKPRPWQTELHNARRCRRRVCVVHRQGGKSEGAAFELIEAALLATGDLPRFAYVSPELKLARKMFWPKLKARLRPLVEAGSVEFNESDLSVRFKSNGATIEMFGASDPDSLRGHTMRGVVIDEVAQMPGSVWGELISPWLKFNNGWALFIGTPKGVNLFSELYHRAAVTPGWWAKRWTVYETGIYTAEQIQEEKDQLSEATFAREWLCDFNAQSNEQLISMSLAMEATQRVFKPGDAAVLRAPVVLGVDPARFGDDRSVIVRRQGLFMHPPLVFKGVDTAFLGRRVALEINQHRPAAVFIDEGGVGAGVLDTVRSLGHVARGVQFGSRSPEKGFVNLRAYMWWQMREWLQNGGRIPEDQALIRELATPTYGFNGKGDVVLESKDDIKERLSAVEFASPDIADALACTFAAPVATTVPFDQERERAGGEDNRRRRRYDPFDMRMHMPSNVFRGR